MNSDFWTTRLAAAKRQLNMHSNTNPSSQLDELDFEDEIRSHYPCPYCYSELDIGSLCSHIEDEHSCESKPTVCPICSVKVSGDMLSHITLQHGNLLNISFCLESSILSCSAKFNSDAMIPTKLKDISLSYDYLQRRRRLRRVPVPSSQALSLLGRDLRDAHLQVLLGGSRSNSSPSSSTVTDTLLSSLISTLSASEIDEISMSSLDMNLSKGMESEHMWKLSFVSSLSDEEREQRIKQATGRANFVQDLLVSTLIVE